MTSMGQQPPIVLTSTKRSYNVAAYLNELIMQFPHTDPYLNARDSLRSVLLFRYMIIYNLADLLMVNLGVYRPGQIATPPPPPLSSPCFGRYFVHENNNVALHFVSVTEASGVATWQWYCHVTGRDAWTQRAAELECLNVDEYAG